MLPLWLTMFQFNVHDMSILINKLCALLHDNHYD